MNSLDPNRVIDQYDEGVRAIAQFASEREGRAWHKTIVGEWSAHELARHLVVVSGWYHEWLDRALAGNAEQPFPAKQLDDRNELAILDIRDVDGPEAIDQFVERATTYADRLRSAAASGDWDTPYGFAHGIATVGGHAGIAAGEWHLHAWDLSGGAWAPTDPSGLYLAVGSGMTATQSRLKQKVTRRVVARIANGEPWLDLLGRSGRSHTTGSHTAGA